MRLTTRSASETRAIGSRLGRLLRGLDLVCLSGDLGSGKTTFTQGLARGLGFKGKVTSPTFVLARVYRGAKWRINHLDLYRVEAKATGDIGIEEYSRDPRGVCVVEWPEAGSVYYPPERLDINFSHGADAEERRLILKPYGPRAGAILRRLRRD